MVAPVKSEESDWLPTFQSRIVGVLIGKPGAQDVSASAGPLDPFRLRSRRSAQTRLDQDENNIGGSGPAEEAN